MNHWIFQGNPDKFDISTYVTNFEDLLWSVRQKHFANEMREGDEVFIWRARGKTRETAGVIAQGILTGRPDLRPDDVASHGLWVDDSGSGIELRVPLPIQRRMTTQRKVIKREWLEEDPILTDIRILKLRSETNYRIGSNEAQRLSVLCRNTGKLARSSTP